MGAKGAEKTAEFGRVQIVRDMGTAWLFLIGGKFFRIAPAMLLPGSTVRWPDARRGKLVIPEWLASHIGLV